MFSKTPSRIQTQTEEPSKNKKIYEKMSETMHEELAQIPVDESGSLRNDAVLELYLRIQKKGDRASLFLDLLGIKYKGDLNKDQLNDLLIDHLTSEKSDLTGKKSNNEDLMKKQDMEFQKSLAEDKEKDRIKEEEERIKKEQEERLDSLEQLNSMPADRKRAIISASYEEKFKRLKS